MKQKEIPNGENAKERKSIKRHKIFKRDDDINLKRLNIIKLSGEPSENKA